MTFIPISEKLWPAIYELQTQVYNEIEPESIEVLRSKWLRSPDCCFAYTSDLLQTNRSESGFQIKAYLLAHTIAANVSGIFAPPKLHQPLCLSLNYSGLNQGMGLTQSLFLHDLAVSKELKGTGVGQKMVAQLLSIAVSLGYQQVFLVAIQGSVPFWIKMGFKLDNSTDAEISQYIEDSYGKGAKPMLLKLN